MQVAGFIFGGNVKEGKIDMTTPVQTESDSKDKSEKIAMTTPVATEMSGGRYISNMALKLLSRVAQICLEIWANILRQQLFTSQQEFLLALLQG